MTNSSHNTFHTDYLKAMGIQVWVRRNLPPELKNEAIATMPTNVDTISEDIGIANTSQAQISQSITAIPVTQSDRVQTIPARIETAQADTCIENTPQSDRVQTLPPVITNTTSPSLPTHHLEPQPEKNIELNWESLQNRVAICTGCELHQNRTQTVFGIGNQQADVMLIGEAPGADEDAVGEPFVGRAGQLLNAMLYAINFKREEVYIANVVKCRPPGNRNPKLEEMMCCHNFLQDQMTLIQPKLIVAVGRIAAQHLLNTSQVISKIRGHRFEYGEAKIPLIPIFHPAYLLRSPSKKRESWQDLQIIRWTINELLKQ